jgi:hypothetical protein
MQQLSPHQSIVNTRFICKQTLVCPLLDGLPITQDHNVVRLLNGGEAMRDGNGCAIFRKPVECSLDYLFALGINCACGFIKNDNFRLLDDAPGNGKTLFLSPG